MYVRYDIRVCIEKRNEIAILEQLYEFFLLSHRVVAIRVGIFFFVNYLINFKRVTLNDRLRNEVITRTLRNKRRCSDKN